MYDGDFVKDFLEPAVLLERFLSDCQKMNEEAGMDEFNYSYMADTVAAIYYHREYNSSEEFLSVNAEYIDDEREEWVKYMWRTLDSMSNEQRAEVVIESLTQIPVSLAELG
jgi:hypothetical protein